MSAILCTIMCIQRLTFKTWDIKSNCKWTLSCQSFHAKLLTVLICQTFLPSKFFTIQYIVLLLFYIPSSLESLWGYHQALLLVSHCGYFSKSGLSSTNSEIIVMIAMCFCSACCLKLSRLGLRKSCIVWKTPPMWAHGVLPLLWNGMMFCKATEVFQTFSTILSPSSQHLELCWKLE